MPTDTLNDARTVLPNSNEIRRLRKLNGKRQEDLARAAKLNLRTIQNLEAGRPSSVHTIKCVAGALGVPCEQLIATQSPLGPGPEPRRARITVQRDSSELKAEKLDEFKLNMEDAISRGCTVIVYIIEPGSAILTVGMKDRDLVRLVRAFSRGKLRPLAVSAIEVPRPALEAATRQVPPWVITLYSAVRRHPFASFLFQLLLGFAGIILMPSFANGVIVSALLAYLALTIPAHLTRLGIAPAWNSDLDCVELRDFSVALSSSTTESLAASRATQPPPPPPAPSNARRTPDGSK